MLGLGDGRRKWPTDPVVIADDTGRRNAFQPITPELAHQHKVKMEKGGFFLIKDGLGRQVQYPTERRIEYRGRALEVAVRRAERWLRSERHKKGGKPPRHIRDALAVLSVVRSRYDRSTRNAS